MENNLRTDTTVNKETMTKEEAEAYDEFITVMAEIFSHLMAIDEGKQAQK